MLSSLLPPRRNLAGNLSFGKAPNASSQCDAAKTFDGSCSRDKDCRRRAFDLGELLECAAGPCHSPEIMLFYRSNTQNKFSPSNLSVAIIILVSFCIYHICFIF